MSFYGTFSNTNADGSPVTFTQAMGDVFLHPLDSLRGFVAAPIALLAGTSASAAKTVSGMALDKTSDLPSVVDIVSSTPSTQTTPVTTDQAAASTGIPLWLEITIGVCAVVAVAMTIKKVV